MEENNQHKWHNIASIEVLSSFLSSKKGLSESEAKHRLEENGYSKLPNQALKSRLSILFTQFANPLILILLLAGIIGVVLQEWVDVSIIFAVILVNTVLGFIEEYRADRTLSELKSYLPISVKVRRDGVVRTILSEEVVTGDILLVSSGDKIMSDGRILKSQAFEVNESALTGESKAIKKSSDVVNLDFDIADQTSMVFAGTVVVSGYAEIIVTAIGIDTELGAISELVSDLEEEDTPLQHQLSTFSKFLGIIVVGLAIFIFSIGLWRGMDPLEVFYTAVAVAVASVPEGLVIAVTMILAIGMQRMLKKKILVRKLIAAETLGSVSVLCMDKTGTLTTGAMAITEIRNSQKVLPIDGDDKNINNIRRALLNTSAAIVEKDKKTGEDVLQGSLTEISLLKYAQSFLEDSDKFEMIADLPFTHERKFAARSLLTKEGRVLYAVGAPEMLIERADISDEESKKLFAIFEDMTKRGLRVLAAAQLKNIKKHEELNNDLVKDIEIIGFIGLKDPLRKESRNLIESAIKAHIRPVMITGDHPDTATAIAKEAGFNITKNSIITGAELDTWSDDELFDRVSDISVYARVKPVHKMRIIQAWQNRGESVAMTGDGVNDAPALKTADIGIALGSGTSVAKEAADMVILEDDFSTVIIAIEEGRTIFDNIKKTIVNMLADSFSEVILVVGAIALLLPMPILPAQILLINLIADGLPSIALAFEPSESDIMNEPPRKKNAPLLDREMKIMIFGIGILSDVVLFYVFFHFMELEVSIEEVRSFMFAALSLNSLLYVFAIRKFRSSIFSSNLFENKFLIIAVLLSLIMLVSPFIITSFGQIMNIVPLTLNRWISVIGLSVGQLTLIEIVKEVYNIRKKSGAQLA